MDNYKLTLFTIVGTVLALGLGAMAIYSLQNAVLTFEQLTVIAGGLFAAFTAVLAWISQSPFVKPPKVNITDTTETASWTIKSRDSGNPPA